MAQSLFVFQFRLLPWEGCLNLNFENMELARGFRRLTHGFKAVCTRDQLWLLTDINAASFEHAQQAARQLASALVDAHGYFSFPDRLPLDLQWVSWLEVKGCGPRSTVSGYADPSLLRAKLVPAHPDNEPLLAAGDLLRRLGNNLSLALALADFRAARRELGPYYAFFAYRVLEDIGFAFGEKGGAPNWPAMNKALGTTKEHWDDLTKTGTAARHLNKASLTSIQSKPRKALLDLARDALSRYVTYLS